MQGNHSGKQPMPLRKHGTIASDSRFALVAAVSCISCGWTASAQSQGSIITAPAEVLATRSILRQDTTPPADTKFFIAKRGTAVVARTVWYINTIFCSSSGTGSFTTTVDPMYGSLSFQIQSVPLPPGYPCAGQSFPANVAYYTWTAPDTAPSKTDLFQLYYVSDDSSQSAVFDFDALLNGPKIFMSGVDITDTPQPVPVVAGQQIVLMGEPESAPGNGTLWSLVGESYPDDYIGGFIVGNLGASGNCVAASGPQPSCGATTEPDFTQSTTAFYYTDRGHSRLLNYTYYPTSGSPEVARARFDVDAPIYALSPKKGPMPNTKITDIKTGTYKGKYLDCGNSFIGFPGACIKTGAIEQRTSTLPPPGSLQWVQLLVYDVDTIKTTNGQTQDCSVGSEGLDNQYPDSFFITSSDGVNYAYDTPEWKLGGSKVISHDVNFEARLFLMWTPSVTGNSTIPVPLGYVDWQWNATVVKNGAAWGKPSTLGAVPIGVSIGSLYPTWQSVIINGSEITCTVVGSR